MTVFSLLAKVDRGPAIMELGPTVHSNHSETYVCFNR